MNLLILRKDNHKHHNLNDIKEMRFNDDDSVGKGMIDFYYDKDSVIGIHIVNIENIIFLPLK